MNSTVGQRVIAVLIVPLIGVSALASLRVADASGDLADVDAQASVARATAIPAELIVTLLDERNASGVELIALSPTDLGFRQPNVASARRATDTAFDDVVRSFEATNSKVRERYIRAIERAKSQVRIARRMFDDHRTTPQAMDVAAAQDVFDLYTNATKKLHEANDAAIKTIDDAELRNRARSVADQSLVTDLDAQLIIPVLRWQLVSPTLANPEAAKVLNRIDAAELRVRWDQAQVAAVSLLAGAPTAREVVSEYLERRNQKQFRTDYDWFIRLGQGDPMKLTRMIGQESQPNSQDAVAATRAAIDSRATDMTEGAKSRRAQALLIFGVTVIGSVLVAVFAARSLVRPLARLASGARLLIDEKLPRMVGSVLGTTLEQSVEPPNPELIPRQGVREVDEAITALNDVQTSALELAVGQAHQRNNAAASLVNIARRMQGLTARQLEMLATLELDGDTDASETLLRIDQVATRIRRNSGALIIVAGSRQPVRAGRGKPVAVSDVIGAAIAEVEEFERVRADTVTSVDVASAASPDLSHLLAELIENALSFSPPGESVDITGLIRPGGGYSIDVSDAGIGMTPEALAEANTCLAGGIEFGQTPVKFLGHFVVGVLAERHGFVVNLVANDSGGVTARVEIPSTLVTVTLGRDRHETPVGVDSSTGSLPALIRTRRELEKNLG